MKKNDLLSPHRVCQGSKKLHDGKIITERPNSMWATDATKTLTIDDGAVWFFGIHGSQFTSKDYRNQLRYWGITPSFSLVREPETNGVVERFHRTFKEQIIHGRAYQNIQELHSAVSKFIEMYNEKWLLQKLGYLSPHEARRKWEETKAM